MTQRHLDALYSYLQRGSKLNRELRGRIYQGAAPMNVERPLMVYNLVTADVDRSMATAGRGVTDDFLVTVQIDLFADDDYGQKNLGDLARELYAHCQGARFPIEGHDRVTMTCENPGLDLVEDRFIRRLTEWRLTSTEFAAAP